MKSILAVHVAVLVVMFASPQLTAQTSSVPFQTDVSAVGTSAATFLEIGVGARAMAMGGAYAAVANDATGLYWNPAGSAWISTLEIEATHNAWLLESNHEYVGIAIPLASINSTLGLTCSTLGFGAQPVRTVDRPEGTGETYDARDFMVGISFAKALTNRFAFGITGKYISQRIWFESGSAFAIDLGIYYVTPVEGLRLGACMSNFGTALQLNGNNLASTVSPDNSVQTFDRAPVEYKTTAGQLPVLFRFGIAYEASLGNLGNTLLSVDVNHPSNAKESINAGIEYGFQHMFYLRAGYQDLFEKDRVDGLTLGVGVDLNDMQLGLGIRVDYAWSDWGILKSAQRISVGVQL